MAKSKLHCEADLDANSEIEAAKALLQERGIEGLNIIEKSLEFIDGVMISGDKDGIYRCVPYKSDFSYTGYSFNVSVDDLKLLKLSFPDVLFVTVFDVVKGMLESGLGTTVKYDTTMEGRVAVVPHTISGSGLGSYELSRDEINLLIKLFPKVNFIFVGDRLAVIEESEAEGKVFVKSPRVQKKRKSVVTRKKRKLSLDGILDEELKKLGINRVASKIIVSEIKEFVENVLGPNMSETDFVSKFTDQELLFSLQTGIRSFIRSLLSAERTRLRQNDEK